LIDKLFFNAKRYDLGDVGRFRMNDKLNLNIPMDTKVLTIEDIIAIMKSIIKLKNGNVNVDDIDHLGNRRVRTVGEQLNAAVQCWLSQNVSYNSRKNEYARYGKHAAAGFGKCKNDKQRNKCILRY
jgi:DNA-directed RNA polymerase beta subunit